MRRPPPAFLPEEAFLHGRIMKSMFIVLQYRTTGYVIPRKGETLT